jgi:inhibitor of cysteine peptidase
MRFVAFVCLGLWWPIVAGAAEPKPIAVTVGEEFKITLQYNATTGYQWQLSKPPDEKLVKLLGSEYKRADSTRIGAGGDQVWTFKALAEGKTAMALDYVRPWEKGTKPAQSTNFVVVVNARKAKGRAPD